MTEDRTARRVPAELRIRELEVVRVVDLAPAMRRFVLAGDELEGAFPMQPFAPGEHVKMFFPDEATGLLHVPRLVDGRLEFASEARPQTRDYTVRAFDAAARELTVDFVLHPHGPAGRWAAAARVGDRIGVGGPRGSLIYPSGYRRYVLIADATALPALARWLEEAPEGAEIVARAIVPPGVAGYALPSRAGADVAFIEADSPAAVTPELVSLIDDDPDAFVWAAGESTSLKPLRSRLREVSASKDRFDVDGYWKEGAAEFDHHAEAD